MLALRIGSDAAGIYSTAFTSYQSFSHTALQYLLKQITEGAALAKTTMPILGESRMVGHSVF